MNAKSVGDIVTQLQLMLNQLVSAPSAAEKEAIAGSLDEIFETILVRKMRLSRDIAENSIRTLVREAGSASVNELRSELLHTLVTASMVASVADASIDPRDVLEFLPGLEGENLEYALAILGFSGHEEVAERIHEYTSHASPSIREAASIALRELLERRS